MTDPIPEREPPGDGPSDEPGMARLPKERIDRLSQPFLRFLRIEAAAGAILLMSTVFAVALSNSPLADTFLGLWELPLGIRLGALEITRSLRSWINDGLMTLFFFLVALELKRELVLGELRHPRVAALSIAAALGGMLVPAVLFLLLQWGQPGEAGWGTVMATDTAFVIGCLALLGSRVPPSLRIFMLSLAIVDDIGAILVVAVGYGHHFRWEAVALSALGFAMMHGMARLGVRSLPAYFLGGILIWIAIDASGIHATLTGVILGLMTPTGRWVSGARLRAILDQVDAHPSGQHRRGDIDDRMALHMAEAAARETLSPVERLEAMLHPWVAFLIMPLFAFANAGVALSFGELTSSLTLAVFLGFVLGKPAGVLTFSWLALRVGIAVRPPDLSWRLLTGGSLLAGIGFTMAIFIANLAFSPDLIDAAKLGILSASVVSAAAGLALLSASSARAARPVASNKS